jgi:hypothetical protein
VPLIANGFLKARKQAQSNVAAMRENSCPSLPPHRPAPLRCAMNTRISWMSIITIFATGLSWPPAGSGVSWMPGGLCR